MKPRCGYRAVKSGPVFCHTPKTILIRAALNGPAALTVSVYRNAIRAAQNASMGHSAFDYMTENRNLIWVGPTGCGKTGLATGFLIQAIQRGYTGMRETNPS